MIKKLLLLFAICALQGTFAQQAYYDDVDLSLTGQDLYFELQQKISNASGSWSYSDSRDALPFTDEDPDNSNNVLLIYGFQDDNNCNTDRSRDKDNFGGNECQYNREHTFSQSNANPPMSGNTGIRADPHNLRASDVRRNGDRGNKKLAAGSGNSGDVAGGNWFPGEEWKGDVARIMMYMYTRYGDRCIPSGNGASATQPDNDMLQIYLQWNVEDPVNFYEDQRNSFLEPNYGNRNPFIDNPVLATIIWGGPQAEDRWDILGVTTSEVNKVSVYPNPAQDVLWVANTTSFTATSYTIFDITGKKIGQGNFNGSKNAIDVSNFNSGVYLLKLNSLDKGAIVKKIIVK